MKLIVALIFAFPLAAQFHINSGGPATIDHSIDKYFAGGDAYKASIPLPTGAPEYFRTERAGEFSYHFPLDDGPYVVTLSFIENSVAVTGPNQRIFSVTLNGELIIPSLDLAAKVGLNVPLNLTFTTMAAGGGINLNFHTIARNAVVSAIDIMPAIPATPVSPFPGCLPDGDDGVQCKGGFTSGMGTSYVPTLSFAGITFISPTDVLDPTGKMLKDSGQVDCTSVNIRPSLQKRGGMPCHQLVWGMP